MPQLVTVSSIENSDKLMNYVNDLFERRRYAEITHAIGMHSILIDPEHMIGDQDSSYHLVLNLLKKRLVKEQGASYSAWLTEFPVILAGMVEKRLLVTDEAAQSALASRHSAFGPFSSLDEFYFWALEDRRLPIDQIIAYIDKSIELHHR